MSKVGLIPSFSVIILAIGLMNHVLVIPLVLEQAKRDAWLSVLLATPLFLIWIWILFYIIKKTNQQPLLIWIRESYGAVIVNGIKIIFIVYFLAINLLTLKDTASWTHVFYLPSTPTWVIAVSMVLLSFFAAKSGFQAIGITAGMLLPFVIIFGDFVMSANLPEKNYSILIPMFENGLQPVIRGMIYVGGGLAELLIILCIQHHIKPKIRLIHLIILGGFLVILILGPLTGAIAEFGPFEAAKQRYPAYEEWRLVSIGRYIQNVDFLSIYQWLSGSFIRISITMWLIVEFLGIQEGPKRRNVLLLIGFIMICFSQLPISDMRFIHFLSTVYFPLSLWTIIALSLFLFVLVLFKRKLRSETESNGH